MIIFRLCNCNGTQTFCHKSKKKLTNWQKNDKGEIFLDLHLLLIMVTKHKKKYCFIRFQFSTVRKLMK